MEKLIERIAKAPLGAKIGAVVGALVLYADNGIISTLKQHLTATEQAAKAGDRLRTVVLKQAERGKETVDSARSEQEKAIGAVNTIVVAGTEAEAPRRVAAQRPAQDVQGAVELALGRSCGCGGHAAA